MTGERLIWLLSGMAIGLVLAMAAFALMAASDRRRLRRGRKLAPLPIGPLAELVPPAVVEPQPEPVAEPVAAPEAAPPVAEREEVVPEPAEPIPEPEPVAEPVMASLPEPEPDDPPPVAAAPPRPPRSVEDIFAEAFSTADRTQLVVVKPSRIGEKPG